MNLFKEQICDDLRKYAAKHSYTQMSNRHWKSIRAALPLDTELADIKLWIVGEICENN